MKLQIIVTGRGYPDVATRAFLCVLWQRFHLPTFAIVDWDPHGVDILSVYSGGSRAMGLFSDYLALPSIQWIGLHFFDVSKVSPNCLIELSKHDIKKAKELMQDRPGLSHHKLWIAEIQHMIELGKKMEIEALASVSLDYLCLQYLPTALRSGSWI